MTDKIIAGKYKVVRELGRGGMGVIYEALHIRLNRIVAIKVLHPHLTDDPAFLKRFQREARAMARLDHENIIRVFDVSEDQGSHYIEMEFFPGKDLKQVMIEESPFSQKRALVIARSVASALSYAHSQGIIHRDIKPANVMVNNTGLVKIADFGIAAATDEVSVTATGNIIGTPEYMSPEQARGGEELDGRSDLYALGMVLHEMLTGRTTFGGVSGMAILGKLVYEPQEFDLFFPDDILPSAKELTAALLKKNRNERSPDAATVTAHITKILSGLKEQPDPDETSLQMTLLEKSGLEDQSPETVILGRSPAVEQKNEVLSPTPTVVVEKGKKTSPAPHSKKSTPRKKTSLAKKKIKPTAPSIFSEKKSVLLISAASILSIFFAGMLYYFSSLDDGKTPTQQTAPPVLSPSLSDEIKGLQRSLTQIEQKLVVSRKAADSPEVRRLAKELIGLGIDMEGRGEKQKDDAHILLEEDNKKEAKEAFQTALSLLSKADEHFKKAKQTAEVKVTQEARSQTEKEKKKQKTAEEKLAQLKNERAKTKKERLKQEKLTRLEQKKLKEEQSRTEKERLNRKKAVAERERLEQERTKAKQERLKQEAIVRTEKKKLEDEKNKVEQKKRAKAEQNRIAQERAAAERKKREQERIRAEEKQKAQEKIAAEKKPSPITPAQMNVLGGMLNKLKTAYDKKDLKALQRMSQMSKNRARFLEQIFGNYQTITVSIADLSIIGNEAHVVISITKLTSQDGNLVVPSKRWKDAALLVHRKGGKWGKIVW